MLIRTVDDSSNFWGGHGDVRVLTIGGKELLTVPNCYAGAAFAEAGRAICTLHQFPKKKWWHLSSERCLVWWNARTGEEIRRAHLPTKLRPGVIIDQFTADYLNPSSELAWALPKFGHPTVLFFSDNGRRAAILGWHRHLHFFSLTTGEVLREVTAPSIRYKKRDGTATDEWLSSGVTVSPNFDYAVWGEEDSIWLWEATSGERAELPAPKGGWTGPIAISRNGQRILAQMKKRRYTWDLCAPQPTGIPLEFGAGPIALSPDGRLAATAVKEGMFGMALAIFDVNSQSELARFEGSAKILAFSDDGTLLAAADRGKKNRVEVWKLL
jgi:hypothetical protein